MSKGRKLYQVKLASGREVEYRFPGVREFRRLFRALPAAAVPTDRPGAAHPDEEMEQENLDFLVNLVCTCCVNPKFVDMSVGDKGIKEGELSIDDLDIEEFFELFGAINGTVLEIQKRVNPTLETATNS